jgi:hypothetical protein
MMPEELGAQASPVIATAEASQVALKVFFALTDRWGCSSYQQRVLLGSIGATTLYRYRRLPSIRLSQKTLQRISHLMGIHRALTTIFGDNDDRIYGWVKSPNMVSPFNGQSALQYMMSAHIEEINYVHRYLARLC